MSKIITLRKGLDIRLQGEAQQTVASAPAAAEYAVSPLDFEGVTPKLLVKVGDEVKAGTPLFFNKYDERVLFTSPVSGTVSAVNRGEKRKALNVTVKMFVQRPYGIIADPSDAPKAIFVSAFDSAPLAPDYNFVLRERTKDLQKGIEVLRKLTTGKVHLSVRAKAEGQMAGLTGVELHAFAGKHPVGNVGVQIHHIDPVNKGEVVWTINIQDLAIVGRLFNEGRVDMTKIVAVAGSEVRDPGYRRIVAGASVASILGDAVKPQKEGDSVRIISGNVLTGTKTSADGYISFYANQLTVIPEGDKYEMLGWAMPRFDKFSVSRAYFSWLRPKKRYDLDTNMHGGERPFVVTGLYEQYLPMDIYPMYLLKACLAKDIDKMENLGIYEVTEEDFALCEFVDPSKIEIQQIIRDGINLMIKEA